MKRGDYLQRRTPLSSHTPLKRNTKLRVAGKSEVSEIKRDIQETLRQIVIQRDKGCILRLHKQHWNLPPCNGYDKNGKLVLQADHLISRSNSATYADSRLVVCVCRGHHGWKSVGSNARKKQYDDIVRTLLPKDRVELWDRCEQESWRPTRKYNSDWKLQLIALQDELNKL